jgi:hypothetical protein
MIKQTQNFKKLILSLFSIGFAGAINAQCLSITCPGNMTVAAANGSCGAVVNYSAAVVSSTCGITTTTYNYTGAIQTFVVPNGVTSLIIDARGAQGGDNQSLVGLGGKGARMVGTYTATPGQTLNIIVGQKGANNTGGNAANGAGGGGGGSFVYLPAAIQPMIAAGGGGGSSLTNNGIPNYYGKDAVTTTSATGSRSNDTFTDSPGGTNGANGTSICGSGGKGWIAIMANPAGNPAGNVTYGAAGGYGGGGGAGTPTNICNDLHTAGGGGGYSGGGAGGTCYYYGGGGGGSYNVGTNQTNTPGFQSNNGQVMISYSSGTYTNNLIAGLASGSTFSVGTTVQTYSVVDSFSNTATCSFSVLVTDAQTPTITCPSDATVCGVSVPSIAPVSVLDNCPSPAVTYTLLGATAGTGVTNASGTFSLGVTTVTYKATDASGNTGTCSFSVTTKAVPSVSITGGGGTVCAGNSATLTASGASTYSWNTGSTSSSIVVTPTANASYTAVGTATNGCSNTVTTSLVVSPCTGLNNTSITLNNLSVYPNPNNGEFTISAEIDMNLTIENSLGQVVKTVSLNQSNNHKVSISNLANGIYFVVGNVNNQNLKQKIIVSK